MRYTYAILIAADIVFFFEKKVQLQRDDDKRGYQERWFPKKDLS
jgi:hypothetical protein